MAQIARRISKPIFLLVLTSVLKKLAFGICKALVIIKLYLHKCKNKRHKTDLLDS